MTKAKVLASRYTFADPWLRLRSDSVLLAGGRLLSPCTIFEYPDWVDVIALTAALNIVHEALPDAKVVTCLEITAGQGTSLGYKLEHLADIISLVKHPRRLGVCLDSCHLLASGYDIRTPAGLGEVVNEFTREVGIKRLGGAFVRCFGHQVVPPVIAALSCVNGSSGAFVNDDMLH